MCLPSALPHFDGATYAPRADFARLHGQLARVFTAMESGEWRTLDEIREEARGSVASVSARLRDLRKAKFGAHTVDRRARGDRERGLFEYKLTSKAA